MSLDDGQPAKDRKQILRNLLSELKDHDLSGQLMCDLQNYAASGGFGEVYQARLADGTAVAIKRLKPVPKDREDNFVRRLTRELRVWASLHHDNILPLKGYLFTSSGPDVFPCFVTEWMDKGSVDGLIKNQSQLDYLSITRGIAQGLEYLHDRSVVHADMKAANVLVSASGMPLITDFGLSHFIEQTADVETATSARVGSLRWLAPELMCPADDGEDGIHTQASDVWAFALTIGEILGQEVPYSDQRDYQVISWLIRGKTPPKPKRSTSWAELQRAIWVVCEHCLTIDPGIRPTMVEVLQELEKLDVIEPRREEPVLRGVEGPAVAIPPGSPEKAPLIVIKPEIRKLPMSALPKTTKESELEEGTEENKGEVRERLKVEQQHKEAEIEEHKEVLQMLEARKANVEQGSGCAMIIDPWYRQLERKVLADGSQLRRELDELQARRMALDEERGRKTQEETEKWGKAQVAKQNKEARQMKDTAERWKKAEEERQQREAEGLKRFHWS